jgi:heme-degrading monooxygenase HmoA
MYAVIFRARINRPDDAYAEMVVQMREKAISQYGCNELISATEGELEITISYWNNLEQIQAWKQDAEHQLAQKLGRSKWYKSYEVQVVEILREYGKDGGWVD